MSSAHREHDQIFRKPRQPALSHPHDHSWPGERRQGLASCEKPRTRGSEGGRPRQQDGLRDLPDTTTGYQGGPSSFLVFFWKYAFNAWLLSGTWVILVTSPKVIYSIQERTVCVVSFFSYLKILIGCTCTLTNKQSSIFISSFYESLQWKWLFRCILLFLQLMKRKIFCLFSLFIVLASGWQQIKKAMKEKTHRTRCFYILQKMYENGSRTSLSDCLSPWKRF